MDDHLTMAARGVRARRDVIGIPVSTPSVGPAKPAASTVCAEVRAGGPNG